MKRLLNILPVLLLVISGNAQKIQDPEDMKHFRIQLDNRTNRHLTTVPKQILDAYCAGTLKGYFPKSAITEVNFGDFLDHFRWGEPVESSGFCGDSYCDNPVYQDLFSRFNTYLDYYEFSSYNPGTSLLERKVIYVQLVYSVNAYGLDYHFKGPLFRLDEMENLIHVQNPGNSAASLSVRQVFDQAMFYSSEQTLAEVKSKEKRTAREDDFQEH